MMSEVKRLPRKAIIWVAFFVCMACPVALGDVYVDRLNGDDGNDGSADAPFAGIQVGIDAVAPGGTVIVAGGIYPEAIELNKAGITVRSADGPEATIIDVPPGTLTTGVRIYKDLGDVTLDGFTIRNFTSSGIVQSWAHRDGTAAHIWNNRVIPAGDYMRNGIQVAGEGSTVKGNYVLGSRLTASWGSCGIHIVDNSRITVENNTVIGHPEYGMDVGIAVNSEPPCENIVITGNTIDNVDQAFQMAGYAGGVVNGVAIHFNRVSDYLAGVAKNEFQGEGTVAFSNISATHNWWGFEEGPPEGSVMDNVPYSPWYADYALTDLRYLGDGTIGEDTTIAAGESLTAPGVLTVAAGSTMTVFGDLDAGELDIEEGATLHVIGGALTLGTADGGKHTMSGTFSIYNSFGSMVIDADTEFEGDVLMLISDIHVADEVKLTVTGSLILDGCVIDCLDEGGRFAIEVAETGLLVLERTELSNCDLALGGDGALVRNNLLSNVAVTVTGTGNAVYHNVFLTGLDPDPIDDEEGTDTILALDGWGNVDSLEGTWNDLGLALTAEGLDGTRTLEAGDLYVQPGDVVMIDLDVARLTAKIQGAEAMLGFNTNFFNAGGASSLGPVEPWEYEIHNVWTNAGMYGKIDTAVGLSVSYPDPAGTDGSGTVARVALETWTGVEGVTRFYFRPRLAEDDPMAATQLTGNLTGEPEDGFVLAPFTLNSGYLTVDGTDPEIANFIATQVQEGVPEDVFDESVTTHQGTVVFIVDARDDLAGIADEDVILTVQLRDDPGVELVPVLVSAAPEGDWTRYTFSVTIGAETPNGIYDAAVTAWDRSGNNSDTLEGAFEVQKNQVEVTVQLQGAVAGPFDRDVVFTATDGGGGVLKSWTQTLTFTDGTGTATLREAPDGMVRLSAKTAWTLRVGVTCAPDVNGQSAASFSGDDQLPGGDLNDDNRVDMLDFAILRYHWYQEGAAADITGSGVTNLDDYNILQSNWYTMGDEL